MNAAQDKDYAMNGILTVCKLIVLITLGTKTIKKNTNSTQNKSETHHAKQYEVTSFLSTDCELSTETCSKNVYSLGPRSRKGWLHLENIM